MPTVLDKYTTPPPSIVLEISFYFLLVLLGRSPANGRIAAHQLKHTKGQAGDTFVSRLRDTDLREERTANGQHV